MAGITDVLVAIATYKRPDQLRQLLTSLGQQSWTGRWSVVVVDNDAEGSALATCQESPIPVTYRCEPAPGIAAARNAGVIDYSRHDAIAFIDDDEVADPQWLRELVTTAESYEADVVAAPVLPSLPPGASKVIRAYPFFERPRMPTGSTPRWPATNNSLVLSTCFDAAGTPFFSEDFSVTGGEDAEFFWRLRQGGKKFVYCDTAIVTEAVPLDRARLSWVWRRNVRLGNVSARLLVRSKPRPIVVVIGLARMLVGAASVPVAAITRSQTWLVRAMNLPRGVGTLNAVRGRTIAEYEREAGRG